MPYACVIASCGEYQGYFYANLIQQKKLPTTLIHTQKGIPLSVNADRESCVT